MHPRELCKRLEAHYYGDNVTFKEDIPTEINTDTVTKGILLVMRAGVVDPEAMTNA
jgi:hypothetical protein